jgi:ADP-ribose pyrophosphatase YjhB (NUDIX family)
MFKFCPNCASKNIIFKNNRAFSCPDCNFFFFFNVAAATGCIIDRGEDIAFLIRAKEPSFGKLDLPGGFVDPDEGAVECIRRELREETGWEPDGRLAFFASFPNTYPYKGVVYKTCDVYFTIYAPEVKESDFNIDASENSIVRFVKYSEINFDDLAFDPTKRVIKAFIENKK